MGATTKISWCDATHNFWRGCFHASLGCYNCYAETMANRFGWNFHEVTRVQDFEKPLHWASGKRIFTCSISDFFLAEADPWRDQAWEVIRKTPQHTWIILTKRPENIRDRLPAGWFHGWPNVWIGVSVENQPNAKHRIPILLDVPASVHFVSCEPLLGPVDLTPWLFEGGFDDNGEFDFYPKEPGIKWVIAGGESGPKFRPMNLEWAISLRNQCAGIIPFFFKQQAAFKNETNAWLPGFDGSRVEWKQFPYQMTPPRILD